MGFFSKLLGKETEPDPQLSPWQGRLQLAKKQTDACASFWEYENSVARELVKQLLAEAAPAYGNGKVKELPDDGNIDLRGVYQGAPIRFAVWMSFGTFWSIDLRCKNVIGELELYRDQEKIPKHKEADDPWGEEEERRIFLAKGIYVEGYDRGIKKKLAVWSRLPAGLQAQVLAEMERLDMRAIRSFGEEVSLNVKPGLNDLNDPLSYMNECAKLLVQLKEGVSQGAPASAQPDASAPQTPQLTLTCAYCSSLFILTAERNTCPNCGAPAQQ